MSSVKTYYFTFSFPIFISFISFSCFVAVTVISSTVSNRTSESRNPDVTGKLFSLSPIRMIFSCRFHTMSFIRLRRSFLFSLLSESFYHEWVTFCQMPSVHWDNHMNFLLYSMNEVDYNNWFTNVKWINLLVRYMILFIYCWIQFVNILLKVFLYMFMKDIGL